MDAAPPPGTAAGGEESALTGEQGQKEEVRPKDPRELEFVLQRPGMPAIDLFVPLPRSLLSPTPFPMANSERSLRAYTGTSSSLQRFSPLGGAGRSLLRSPSEKAATPNSTSSAPRTLSTPSTLAWSTSTRA